MKKFEKPIFVTKPIHPSISDINVFLKEIFDSDILTNHGDKHNLLENKLKDILNIKNVSVFNNGTIALLTALKTLDLPIGSDVITTPIYICNYSTYYKLE